MVYVAIVQYFLLLRFCCSDRLMLSYYCFGLILRYLSRWRIPGGNNLFFERVYGITGLTIDCGRRWSLWLFCVSLTSGLTNLRMMNRCGLIWALRIACDLLYLLNFDSGNLYIPKHAVMYFLSMILNFSVALTLTLKQI